MANLLIQAETEIEIGVEKALAIITRAETITLKKTPAAVAAVGYVFGAVAAALADVGTVASNPTGVLNIELDKQVVADIKAVWTDVEALLLALGIKLGTAAAAA